MTLHTFKGFVDGARERKVLKMVSEIEEVIR